MLSDKFAKIKSAFGEALDSMTKCVAAGGFCHSIKTSSMVMFFGKVTKYRWLAIRVPQPFRGRQNTPCAAAVELSTH